MTSQASSFAQYRLSNLPQQKTTQTTEQKSESPFSQYRLNKSEKEESYLDAALRHTTRGASRIAEQIIGMPGDFRNIMSAVIDPIVNPIMEKVFGEETVKQGKKIQQQTRILPKSSELKEASIEASKGYTKARGEGERIADEYVQTAANLIGPIKFRKALGLAAAGTLAKEGTKIAGLGEGSQEAAKLGTLLIGSMFNPKGVKNLYNKYYDKAAANIVPGSNVSAGPFLHKLEKLEKELQKGLGAPSENAVLKVIADAKNKIQGGRLFVEDIVASRRSLNEIRGDPALLKRGKTLLNDVAKTFDDAVKLYHNPEFIQNYRAANEAFGGFSESKKVGNYLSNLMGGKPFIKTLFAAGAEAGSGHPELIIPTLAGAGVATGALKSYELMHRIMSSKVLRKYYTDMILNGMKQNARGAIASADKLEKALKKD